MISTDNIMKYRDIRYRDTAVLWVAVSWQQASLHSCPNIGECGTRCVPVGRLNLRHQYGVRERTTGSRRRRQTHSSSPTVPQTAKTTAK